MKHCVTLRTKTRETPFNLFFGVDTVILAKIRNKLLRTIVFDENSNDRMLHEHLTLIDEIRDQAVKRDVHYKKQVARYCMPRSNLQQLKKVI